MEDKELVKIFNPTLKRRETILFFLIVVINGLIRIDSDIRLDMCTRGRWREEVSKTFVRLLYLRGDKSVTVCVSNLKSIIQFLFVLFLLLLCLHPKF